MSAMHKLVLPKLGLAAISSAIALLLPLQVLSHSQSILIVRNAGYWLMLLCCGLFLWKVYSEFRKTKWLQVSDYFKAHWFGCLLAGIIAIALSTRDATGFKILYDEHVLSSTARSMHIDQIAYVQAAGHFIDGELVATVGNTDKRPLLFPFMLSIVHNVFGYDVANAFVLNAALGFVTLALLYGLVARLCSRSYGILSLLLFGGLPLLAQNVTGGGYELFNLCLILALALTAAHYFGRDSQQGGLDLMIMSSVLLANVRYESILYVLVPPAVVLLNYLRSGKLHLTWFSSLTPLLLLAPLLSFRVFRDQPNFIQTSQENFFSLRHLPANLSEAATYLFDWQGDYTNSLLLSVIGLISLLVLLARYLPRVLDLARQRDPAVAFIPVLIVILGATTLTLCNWWGGWTDPATQRFSLPFQLTLVVCTALAFHRVLKATEAPKTVLLLGAGYFLFVSPIHCHRMQHEFRMNTTPGYNWAMRWVQNEAPVGNHLYISESAIGLGLLEVSAIPMRSANAMPERIAFTQELGLFDEVFIFEELVEWDGDLRISKHLTPVSERFKRETIAKTYLSEKRFYRVSRLTEVLPAPAGEVTLPANLPRMSKEEFKNSTDPIKVYYLVLPLVPAS